MSRRARISVLGAGSAAFSSRLVGDLCREPALRGSTVSLMDVDEQRLEAASAVCRRYAAELGGGVEVESTTERVASLEGADIVVNTALVAGHEALRDGWAVAHAHGYRRGGSLHVVHDEAFWINAAQLEFFDGVVDDIERHCPGAWQLLVANPVLAGVTHLGRTRPDHVVIGLCDGPLGVLTIADVLGLDPRRLRFEVRGVNHFDWLGALTYEGRDLHPELDAWLESDAAREFFATRDPFVTLSPTAVELQRRFGALPLGDTTSALGGAWPWWLHTSREMEEARDENPQALWDDYFAWLEEELEQMRALASDDTSDIEAAYGSEPSGLPVVPIIAARFSGEPVETFGNVLNSGAFVPGVPPDIAVEVPLRVEGESIAPRATSPLPPAVLALLLRDRVAPVEVELDAYRTGDRRRLVDLVLMDPWTRSLDQAQRLVDDVLALPVNAGLAARYPS